ncbi:MAG: hypothetical protein JNL38_37100 [Myxococcales bacterium]|nr:hypothetical protein [Myxococcales bacterium]
MKTRTCLGLVLGLLGLFALAHCSSTERDCTDPLLRDSLTCSAYRDGGATGDGGDSGEGGIIKPPDCDLTKEPKDSPACVDDGVGIFVSGAGSDGAAGTKAAPVKSIGKALSLAGSKRVYVCDGSYEGFELKSGTTIAGGFSCTDWKHTGVKPKVQGGDGAKPTVDLVSASGALLLDLEILGPAKGAPNSIALRAQSSTATLRRVKLTGGEGADGADGARTDFTYPVQTDLDGNNAMGGTGGGEKSFTCPGGAVTKGGKGGDSGFNGGPGMPALAGGAGGIVAQACAGPGGGGDGAVGTTPAAGAGAASLGAIDQAAWIPQAGAGGGSGGPGQGGGGGQGITGGGGGSGGAGGCGGAGGGGGKGGGASVALFSLSSTLTVEASELTSGKAGNGGKGLAGQTGQQIFGFKGNGNGAGCQGGNGGKGGDGAAGGGGAGGLSTPVLFKGGKPTLTQTTANPGALGSGGAGGASPTNDGQSGEAKAEHEVK